MEEPTTKQKKSAQPDLSALAARFFPDPLSGLPDLAPIRVERSAHTFPEGRLNLVLPIYVDRWAYGGIPTALRFFEKLSADFKFVRVVITHQTESEFDLEGWPGWVMDRGEAAPRSIALLADPASSLSVSSSDLFIATFWSTATHVKHVVERQCEFFDQASPRFAYIIQDYEPGFYPWSARYMAAKATYSDGQNVIAVFNTHLLADYFANHGHRFTTQYAFEPILNPTLERGKQLHRGRPKERMILVYGRPTQVRNNFEMLLEGLKTWAKKYPKARDWSVISAGEPHADIVLDDGVVLHSRGKLTTEEYADYLSRTWAGVSLMISPHPSYPPLEMAEFGAWVITNTFENKNLSKLSPNVISIDELTPETIAERLAWCCDQYEAGKASVLPNINPVFQAATDEFPFAQDLVRTWRGSGNDQKTVG